jgi:tail fiber protein gp32
MTINAPFFGTSLQILSTFTFPAGFEVTQFADDSDPIDFPSLKIGDGAMGPNGDLVVWSSAAPILMNINIIATSDDDKNLSILAETSRVGRGKLSVPELITASIVYPDGSLATLTGGKIVGAHFVRSATNAGRYKTKAYNFMFENLNGTLY